MAAQEIIARLRWHAGLQRSIEEDVPSIASRTWPRGHLAEDFEEAVADCLRTLDTLNREWNGAVPSSQIASCDDIPRGLVYAITEVIRMIRECQEHASERRAATVFSRAAWRIETAWSGFLSGDVDDLLQYVKEEEAARFE